jgi:hypothetical protein
MSNLCLRHVDDGVFESDRAAERRSPAYAALALVMLHPRCSFSNSTLLTPQIRRVPVDLLVVPPTPLHLGLMLLPLP